MNPFKKAAIIGCGGIATNLAPALSRIMDVVLFDGDKYEPKNVSRQFPALKSTENKAKTLASLIKEHTLHNVEFVESFVKCSSEATKDAWKDVDLIIGCVDNNASRRILIEIAEDLEICCILGGNEHEEGEAHCFIPDVYNPLLHHAFPDTEPAPWACNSDKQIDKHPQTPLANIMASSAIFHIILSLQKVMSPMNAIVHSRLEPLSSTFSRAKNILADIGNVPEAAAPVELTQEVSSQ